MAELTQRGSVLHTRSVAEKDMIRRLIGCWKRPLNLAPVGKLQHFSYLDLREMKI